MNKCQPNVLSRYRLLFYRALLCMAFLGFMGSVRADNQAPTAPGGLQSVRYSSTAGEILWSPATDNVFVVGYYLTRDGQSLGVKDARSLFEPNLQPNRSYHYTVSAVDRQGNRGPALSVTLSGNIAEVSQGVLVDDDSSPDPAIDEPATTNDFSLAVQLSQLTLQEGDSAGVTVGLSVAKAEDASGNVSLSLQANNPKDLADLSYEFSRHTLAADQSTSELTLKLTPGIAPLLKHSRQLTIVASDGVVSSRKTIQVDVLPLQAPDVYLLIGQSNMEGYSELNSRQRYPGGLDERNERIKQLNVRPNSRQIFVNDSSFSDLNTNIFDPPFVTAEDPLHEPRYISVAGKEASFVGLGLTFAKQALTMTSRDIYLVPAAWGATGFCANANGNLAWNAQATNEPYLGGTLLVDRALTRLNYTLRETGGVLRGILWHQGGADSNNPDCARTYAANLTQLVKRLRREAILDPRGSAARGEGASIPIIVATQSKGDDERGRFSVFNAYKQQVDHAHRDVKSTIAYSDHVNNDDLVPPSYPCGQVSCVHFGADSLREQGRRFFAAIKRIWSEAGAYHY